MGKEAEALLRRLEYRGYDSTGASFIDDKRKIVLLKRTGAPSKVCPALGIADRPGQRFIGQVRWATYGAVTDINSQPHHVQCKLELVGAHNGNISNTDCLKAWLSSRGHAVLSDNDGEIIVHLVEEHYAANQTLSSADLAGMRQAYAASGLRDGAPDGVLRMIDAIRKAEALAEGSYAAAVARPQASRRLRHQVGILALRGHGRGRARRLRRGVLGPHVGALQDARPHPPRRGRGALVHAEQLPRLQPARRARLFAAQAQALQALGQGHPAQPALPPLHGAGDPRQSGQHGPDPALLFPRPRQRGAGRDFRGSEGRVQGIGGRAGRPVGEIRRRAAGGVDGGGFRLALLGGRGPRAWRHPAGSPRPANPSSRTRRSCSRSCGGWSRGAPRTWP